MFQAPIGKSGRCPEGVATAQASESGMLLLASEVLAEQVDTAYFWHLRAWR